MAGLLLGGEDRLITALHSLQTGRFVSQKGEGRSGEDPPCRLQCSARILGDGIRFNIVPSC